MGLYVFLRFLGSLYILDIYPLSAEMLENIFLHSVSYLFTFWIVFFAKAF